MKEKDRRYRKTEDAIIHSMIFLLNQSIFEDLSIKDLIKEADINRSTFYLHYQSLDGVLSALEDLFVSSLFKALPNPRPENFAPIVKTLVDFVSNNKDFAYAVMNAANSRLPDKAFSSFSAYFFSEQKSRRRKAPPKSVGFLLKSLLGVYFLNFRLYVSETPSIEKKTLIDYLTSVSEEDFFVPLLKLN